MDTARGLRACSCGDMRRVPGERSMTAGPTQSVGANVTRGLDAPRAARYGRKFVLAVSLAEQGSHPSVGARSGRDGQMVLAEPGLQARWIHVHRQSLQPRRPTRMPNRRMAGKRHAGAPLDEEWQSGLARRGIDTDAAPGNELASGRDPRARNDWQPETAADRLDRIGSDRPAEWLSGGGGSNPCSERGMGRSLGIDYGDQLDIGVAERNDPVRCAPARVVATLDRGQPVLGLELGCGDREIRDRQDDVVDREHVGRTIRRGAVSQR